MICGRYDRMKVSQHPHMVFLQHISNKSCSTFTFSISFPYASYLSPPIILVAILSISQTIPPSAFFFSIFISSTIIEVS